MYKIWDWCTKLYKMSTKLWSSFLCLNCIWRVGGSACLQHSKFELKTAEEGIVYKIWDWCTKLYKISTKLWSSSLCWNCIWLGGGSCCMSPTHPNLDSGRRKGVQNCTKRVQNYNPVFYLETAFGWLLVTSPQIWIADSARRKDVQNLGLSVQNCPKLLQNYDRVFYVETAFGEWLHVTNPPILNCA